MISTNEVTMSKNRSVYVKNILIYIGITIMFAIYFFATVWLMFSKWLLLPNGNNVFVYLMYFNFFLCGVVFYSLAMYLLIKKYGMQKNTTMWIIYALITLLLITLYTMAIFELGGKVVMIVSSILVYCGLFFPSSVLFLLKK